MNYITTSPIGVEQLSHHNFFPDCGALVTFEGRVRNHHQGRAVKRLYYEAYSKMADKVMAELIADITSEWPDCKVRALHRVGEIAIGEVAVAIAVWAPHRREAFRACETLIDRIKVSVPIWKYETYVDGHQAWVACEHHAL